MCVCSIARGRRHSQVSVLTRRAVATRRMDRTIARGLRDRGVGQSMLERRDATQGGGHAQGEEGVIASPGPLRP